MTRWNRTEGRRSRLWLLLLGGGAFWTGACGGGGGGGSIPAPSPDASPPERYVLGEPLHSLSATERQAFQAGLTSFQRVEDPDEGLGPVFNGRSCAECHAAGAVGGSAPDITVARVTRIGGIENGVYSDLAQYGGPVLEARSLRELIADYYCPGEVVPPQAQFVSHRITTPLFGAGLIEAIPDSAIAARSRLRLPDAVHGVPNYVTNPETGQQEVGRFGWKSQLSKLHVFSGDAYLNEMGVTSAFFPVENNPQGEPIPSGADLAADPEDTDDDVNAFTSFMKFLAPPTPADDSPVTLRGKNVFESIRCTACHVPEMRTGVSSSAALSNKAVRLYSDLLLHRMGAGLADGIRQGSAAGDQFRTAPLWGLSARQFYLHDGRATSLDDAIAQHGGEATNARNRFLNLSAVDRDAVIAFLRSL